MNEFEEGDRNQKHPGSPLMKLRLFIFALLSAMIGSACVHPRFSASGVWVGTARIIIEAEGQKLAKTSEFRFDLKPYGRCTVTIKSSWDVDGAETVAEFDGTWEQRSNSVAVHYNLLDEKNTTTGYATTPRDWNEVQHIFRYDKSGTGLKGTINEVHVQLNRR